MKDDPHAPRHQLHEQAAPTVVHHYEEDETILARWLRRGIEKGPKFWALSIGVLVVVVALTALVGGLSAGRALEYKAWTDLLLAKDADDQYRIAESEAATPVAPWALLQAAQGRYLEGFKNLPDKREAAGPLLNRAYELFDQAEREAPAGSPLRRMAALGKARTLEARNELDKAITQYKEVAQQYKGTFEGDRAAELAQRLQKPESRDFYSKLYAFTPREATLPPGGSTSFGPLPGLPAGHPPLDAPTRRGPGLPSLFGPESPAGSAPGVPAGATDIPIPPLNPSPSAPAPAGTPKTGGSPELPGSVFENNPPPAPQPQPAPAGEAPKAAEGAEKKELPDQPFAGQPKGE